MAVDPNYLTYLRKRRPDVSAAGQQGVAPNTAQQPAENQTDLQMARRLNELYRSQQPSLYESWRSNVEGPAYVSPLPNFYNKATMDFRRNLGNYLYGEQTPQPRTIQQAGVLFASSGLERLERRLEELEQQAAGMTYGQRLNEAPDRRRAREAEMEDLQRQIQEIYGRVSGYIRGESDVQQRIEEDRRRNEEATRLFRFQEEARRRQAEEARMNLPNLQSMATRGFYQTPYAYQNV